MVQVVLILRAVLLMPVDEAFDEPDKYTGPRKEMEIISTDSHIGMSLCIA